MQSAKDFALPLTKTQSGICNTECVGVHMCTFISAPWIYPIVIRTCYLVLDSDTNCHTCHNWEQPLKLEANLWNWLSPEHLAKLGGQRVSWLKLGVSTHFLSPQLVGQGCNIRDLGLAGIRSSSHNWTSAYALNPIFPLISWEPPTSTSSLWSELASHT